MFRKTIESFSVHNRGRRPGEILVEGVRGRVVYSDTPSGLYRQFDAMRERFTTATELMSLRTKAFRRLCGHIGIGEISSLQPDSFPEHELASRILAEIASDAQTYGIWQVRLTTSTAMVRLADRNGADSVFFHDASPFDNPEEIRQALEGELSDGGIRYAPEALERIRNDPNSRAITFKQYLGSKGGNFTSLELLSHPVFSAVCANASIMEEYMLALEVLGIIDMYHRGLYSAWRPGEIRSGFGRIFALGYKGETFYPPNNDTIGHAALVIHKDEKIE